MRASRASPAQKYLARFEGGLILKTFKGLHFFCFGGDSVAPYILLFARETNLKKKRSVKALSTCCLLCRSKFKLICRLFWQSNMHSTFEFCSRPARKESIVPS